MRMGAALVALGELAVGGVGQNCDVRPGIMHCAPKNRRKRLNSRGAAKFMVKAGLNLVLYDMLMVDLDKTEAENQDELIVASQDIVRLWEIGAMAHCKQTYGDYGQSDGDLRAGGSSVDTAKRASYMVLMHRGKPLEASHGIMPQTRGRPRGGRKPRGSRKGASALVKNSLKILSTSEVETLPVATLLIYRADMGLKFITDESSSKLRLRVTTAIEHGLVSQCSSGVYTPQCLRGVDVAGASEFVPSEEAKRFLSSVV